MGEEHLGYLSHAMFMHYILNCLKENEKGTTKAIIHAELKEKKRSLPKNPKSTIPMKTCKSEFLRNILESMESDKLVKSRDATKEDEKNAKERNNEISSETFVEKEIERKKEEAKKATNDFELFKVIKRQSNLIGHGIKIWEITEKGKKLSEYYERVIGLE